MKLIQLPSVSLAIEDPVGKWSGEEGGNSRAKAFYLGISKDDK